MGPNALQDSIRDSIREASEGEIMQTEKAHKNPSRLKGQKISVRPLRRADYKRIREIERAGVDEYARYLKKTGEPDTAIPSVDSAYFRHYLNMGCSFVAETDGKIVGYILSQQTSFVHNDK